MYYPVAADGTIISARTGAVIDWTLPNMPLWALPIRLFLRAGNYIIWRQGEIKFGMPLSGNFWPECCQAVIFIDLKLGTEGAI